MYGQWSGHAMKLIVIPVAPGELADKISILEIKSERINDAAKLENIHRELELLAAAAQENMPDDPTLAQLCAELKAVNDRIWDLEDAIRDCERRGEFGEFFLATARKIYRTNDQRAAIKKQINLHLGASIIEEKSYSDY
ncbi:DUF6165 family protein [Methyloligella solikamskensis]|uniref:DUF6165 family protein n=1 Tax=Methyloligella solikamskensis TaxID=1177756 RepID=A0ABW3JBF9_9HYPH